MRQYRAAYYKDKDTGWYTAAVLDFPGVFSQGRTLRSAQRMESSIERSASSSVAG